MIVEGPAPPWRGGGRYGSWREIESLWDGTQRWQWVPPSEGGQFTTLLQRLYLPKVVESLRSGIRWLDDALLVGLKPTAPPENPSNRGG